MSITLYATETEATYENFIAVCPTCGHRNVYNRATDLKTFEAISFRVVVCEQPECHAEFNINNDRINPAHQGVLFDCCELMASKRYMQATLAISQAYEMLFSHGLRVEVLYRPFKREGTADLKNLGLVSDRLYGAIAKLTFEPMRRLFLDVAVRSPGLMSLADSEAWIDAIPTFGRGISEVKKARIDAVNDTPLRNLLAGLASVQVHKLRNRVVHKAGYRPTRQEVQACLDEANTIIHGLTSRLKLSGDANWYLNEHVR